MSYLAAPQLYRIKLGTKLIRSLPRCSLDKGIAYTRGGGGTPVVAQRALSWPKEHVTVGYPHEHPHDAPPSTQIDCKVTPAKAGPYNTLDIMVAPPLTMALGGHYGGRETGHPGNRAGTMPMLQATPWSSSAGVPLSLPLRIFGTCGPTHGRHGSLRRSSSGKRHPRTRYECAPA